MQIIFLVKSLILSINHFDGENGMCSSIRRKEKLKIISINENHDQQIFDKHQILSASIWCEFLEGFLFLLLFH